MRTSVLLIILNMVEHGVGLNFTNDIKYMFVNVAHNYVKSCDILTESMHTRISIKIATIPYKQSSMRFALTIL